MNRPALVLATLGLVTLAGCGGGGSRAANVELRKEVQRLEEENAVLSAEVASLQAAADVRQSAGDRPEPALLFTTSELKFGRLTGGDDADPDAPGEEVVKIYVVPVDAAGDELKRAGDFTLKIFDAADDMRLVAEQTLPAPEAAKSWQSFATIYGYVFDVPVPEGDSATDLLIRVEFTEALTNRTFNASQEATRIAE